MDAHEKHPGDEIKNLQRCMNDLISIMALPALWSGGDPSQIGRTLVDVLQHLLHLQFIYVQLKDPRGETPLEVSRVDQTSAIAMLPHEIGKELRRFLGDDPEKLPTRLQLNIGGSNSRIVPLRLGFHAEFGMLVAGSERPDFPGPSEELLLRVAANHAVLSLHEVRAFSEQKRLAEALDRRVAERTRDLAAANQLLQVQVGVLQLIPVVAWTVRPDGTPDFVNQNWLEYTGQDAEYVMSHPEAWLTAVHPDDRETASDTFWNGIRAGRDFTMETRFRRAKDGSFRWHLIRAVALRGADGSIIKFVGTSTDIEELKQSQQELRRAEERTRLIIDTALDAVVSMDASGTIISWNKQAEITFGRSSDEAIGQRISELIFPERDRIAYECGIRSFLDKGVSPWLRRRFEATSIRRCGTEFPVELEVIPLKPGNEWIFSVFIHDITESKRAEEKLRQSELSLRQLTETIPEMLWSATPDGTIDYCNTRLLDYTGLKVDEVMVQGWTKLFHPEDVDHATRAWLFSVKSGTPYRVEVRTIHASDRIYRWCVTNALPLIDNDGQIVKWHGTVVDMHDWKVAQDSLRNTQAELANMARVMTMSQLTASIAHEVNQPLSGIITNASTCLRMLDSDPPDIVGARETARRTIRDGNRASDVITRLRALFSKRQTVTESVDLNEATREVVELLVNKLQRNRVVLRTELIDDLPLVEGDRVQLQQVIMNLLQNASDAMSDVHDRERLLLIQTRLDEIDSVRFTVQDSGIGLKPPITERLFDAFYTNKNDGMGIGLAVSRSIIENHQGRIWAQPNDGFGATFSFSVPRCSMKESNERFSNSSQESADNQPAKVARDL